MKNFGEFRKALGAAAKAAGQAASSAVSEVSALVGVKCLRNYTVGEQITVAGPQQLYKIFKGRSKMEGAPYKVVSVWILEKKFVPGDAEGKEAFLELCRRDAQYMTRLKHPCIVRLVEPFEETRTQLVMVTECVVASAHDFIKAARYAVTAASGDKEVVPLSDLEIKHGMLQVAEGLHFLHSEANLVHCGLSPDAIFLTPGGTWKLASLGWARMADFNGASEDVTTFDYAGPNLMLYPPINYTAPELVSGLGDLAAPAADIFSLGAILFEFFTKAQLVPCGPNNVAAYQGRLGSLGLMDMSELPPGMQALVRQCVAPTPSGRPSALGFVGSQCFQDDQLLRALRFLDGMLSRDNLQKAAFLKDLAGFWDKFDVRVLRYKVLPPLLGELRNEALQALVLPLVMSIIQQQEKQDFMDFTLPALKPLCENAKGETLVLLVKNVQLLVDNMPPEAVATVAVPLLLRAGDAGDVRAQEEMLKALPSLHEQLDYTSLKTVMLPKAHALCMRTTSAAVRINSLVAMGKIVSRMDKEEAEKMLATTAQVTAVDKSAPTIMCVVGIGDAVSKQWGPELTATKVLPLLTPLLVASSLSHQQFSSLLRHVKEMVGRIEAKRGGELHDAQALAAHTVAPAGSIESEGALPLKPAGSGGGWDAPNPFTTAPERASPKAAPMGASPMRSSGGAGSRPLPPRDPFGGQQPAPAATPAVAPMAARPMAAAPLGATGRAGGGHMGGSMGGGGSVDPFGASFSALAPMAAAPATTVAPAAPVPVTAGGAGMSGDDLFKDPSWVDPPLSGAAPVASVASHDAFGSFTAAAPAARGVGMGGGMGMGGMGGGMGVGSGGMGMGSSGSMGMGGGGGSMSMGGGMRMGSSGTVGLGGPAMGASVQSAAPTSGSDPFGDIFGAPPNTSVRPASSGSNSLI